jgi:hypothetical protein
MARGGSLPSARIGSAMISTIAIASFDANGRRSLAACLAAASGISVGATLISMID